ncbi:MAG: hypothetical protein CMP34_04515 [Rickettsiales bacterium]|nr:hypothetical protein [Rickettsiales bacterium]
MNSSIFLEWRVENDFKNTRVDYYLKKKFKSLSYPYVCTLLRKGLVKVNGKRVKNSYNLSLDDTIKIKKNLNLHSKEETNFYLSEKYQKIIRSWLIYKDRNFIAINKPSGIAVQGGTKVKINVDDILEGLRYSAKEKPKLIHRLDKQTSGILILARNLKSAAFAGNLFKKKEIKKTYIAILNGKVLSNKGKIDIPIITKDKEYDATTFYEALYISKNISLVKINPLTGRKHQIRKHFFLKDLPIMGETKFIKSSEKKRITDELFLHAFKIEFTSLDGKKIILQADLPIYFQRFLDQYNISLDYSKI